jgi:hypothetical protein
VLDFDVVETSSLTLLERAKLFVKLKFDPKKDRKRDRKQSLKEIISNIKHKTTRHNMISESVLPTKKHLTSIC